MWSILISALAFYLVSLVVPGWRVRSAGTALVVAIVYGILNWLLRLPAIIAFLLSLPLALIIPLPILILVLTIMFTLGLLALTDKLVDGFEIDNMGSAFVGVIVLNLITMLLHLIF